MKALRNGDWVLLDEINLAAAETLECLASLLESTKDSVVLIERGYVIMSCTQATSEFCCPFHLLLASVKVPKVACLIHMDKIKKCTVHLILVLQNVKRSDVKKNISFHLVLLRFFF